MAFLNWADIWQDIWGDVWLTDDTDPTPTDADAVLVDAADIQTIEVMAEDAPIIYVTASGGSMAINTALEYFLGNDTPFEFTVYRSKSKSLIRDISGYTLNFMVKRTESDADGSALFSGTATVTGTYSSDPATNTQRATATISDTDLPVSTTAGRVHWELKRTDAGSETVLAYGRLLLKRPVHDA